MDPLLWMGAVRMTVQTADKNNPHDSSPSINVRSEKLRLCKKQIHHKDIVTIQTATSGQNESIIHNNASSTMTTHWQQS